MSFDGTGAVAAGEHPSLDTLLGYHSGDLPEDRLEEVRSHLVDCPSCLDQFLEIRGFEAAVAEPADAQLDEVRQAAWARLNGALEQEPLEGWVPAGAPLEELPVPVPLTRAPVSSFERWLPRAAAALLAVALGAGLVAALALGKAGRLEDELARRSGSQPAVEELRKEADGLRQDLIRAEGELMLSREDRDRLATELETVVAASQGTSEAVPKQPSTSMLALAVRPAFRLRGVEAPEPLTVNAANRLVPEPPGSSLDTHLVLPAGISAPELLFLLRDDEGRVLATLIQATKTVRGDLGTSLSLPALPPGEYRLEVAGLGTQGDAGLSLRYLLRIENAP